MTAVCPWVTTLIQFIIGNFFSNCWRALSPESIFFPTRVEPYHRTLFLSKLVFVPSQVVYTSRWGRLSVCASISVYLQSCLSCLSSSVYILQSFIHFYIHASINSYITYILISFIQIAFRLSRLCLFSRIRVGVSFSPLSVSVISKKMYISFLHSPLSWFLVGEGCFSYFHF
jgi:hypothetical protein